MAKYEAMLKTSDIPNLKKVKAIISGEVYEVDGAYIRGTETLGFYIKTKYFRSPVLKKEFKNFKIYETRNGK